MRVARLRSAVVVGVSLLAAGCGAGDVEEPDPAVVARGEKLYEASCVQCHGGPTGGSITDIPPRHNAQGHTWHHSDCTLADIVRDGPPPRPEADESFPTMPAFGDQLSDDDIAAILAFIKTWWTDDQRQFQAERTEEECAGR